MADDVEIEIDLGGTSEQKMTVVNPSEFLEGGYGQRFSQKYTDLYLFQFGAYGTTWLLVWEPGGLEDALEKAAEWLADNAPGHIMEHGSETLNDLYKEAAEEEGIAWPPEEPIDWDDPRVQKVDEAATADLTYTESGYLTSYEWYVNEVPVGEPIYIAAFEESLDDQRDELDEEDEERAEKLLRKMQEKKAKQLKNKLLR